MQPNFKLDQKAKLIINRLNSKGFKAYAVGGFVRDSLLGLNVSDIDITTDARPLEIQEIFSDFKQIDIGSKYGTIIILIEGDEYEVTTFRLEGDYLDGRRPSRVEFSKELKEDLKRRDFTVNAMAYHPEEGLVDEFSGREDLKDRVIKTVGSPKERFEEDYLRMLRAVRFASKLDFELDPSLENAINNMAKKISRVAKERINVELNKILMSDHPSKGIELLYRTGLLEYIIEDLHKAYGFDQGTIHHQYDLFYHTLNVLEGCPKILEVRLAAIFHDLGKLTTKFLGDDGLCHFYGHDKVSEKLAIGYMKELKYDNRTIEVVASLVRRHMEAMNTYTEKSVRRLMRKIGQENVPKLFYLQKADILATRNPQFTDNIDLAFSLYDLIIEKDKVVYRNQLAINGRDIIDLGYKEGKEIGLILEHITELVADEVLVNDKEILIAYIGERSYKDEEDNTIRYMFGT